MFILHFKPIIHLILIFANGIGPVNGLYDAMKFVHKVLALLTT